MHKFPQLISLTLCATLYLFPFFSGCKNNPSEVSNVSTSAPSEDPSISTSAPSEDSSISISTIQSEIESSLKDLSIAQYTICSNALKAFDENYTAEYLASYTSAIKNGISETTATNSASITAYSTSINYLKRLYIPELLSEASYSKNSPEYNEILNLILYTLNPKSSDGTFEYDEFYSSLGENLPHYTDYLSTLDSESHDSDLQTYLISHLSSYTAVNLTSTETAASIISVLSSYNFTQSDYANLGFTDYTTIKHLIKSTLTDYLEASDLSSNTTLPDFNISLICNLPNNLSASLKNKI